MSAYINIAVPPEADPEMIPKLFAAIQEKHVGYDLRITESINGKYHWASGYIPVEENSTMTESHIDEHGNLVGSERPAPLGHLASSVAQIIYDVTGDEW